MTGESVELKIAPRPSGLALMFRRTPFECVLRGCTIVDLEAAIPAATMPRQFRVKVRDGMLILRKYGGPQPLNTGWAVKARMEDAVDGVRLTGHQCYLSDRIYFAFFASFSIVVLCLAAWIGINAGLGSAGFTGCLVVATLPGLLALLLVALQPKAVAKQDERANQILRSIPEAG